MKRTALKVVLLVMIAVLTTVPVLAKGTAGIANTIHNFSTNSSPWDSKYYADNVDEICVFCHTPHGGSTAGPLWNHDLPANNFTHYTSGTVSTYLATIPGGVTRAINNESLICMSCHDGSVAVDHLINDPNSANGVNITLFTFQDNVMIVPVGMPAARIGAEPGALAAVGKLGDDHPISFSYQASYDEFQLSTNRVDELNSVPVAVSKGVRFFGADANLECSSCHDPHVNYFLAGQLDYAPFLNTANTGSALCLACHNK